MTDFQVMQCFEASNSLDEVMPDLLFAEAGVVLLVLIDLLE